MYAKLPEDKQEIYQWDTGQYMLVSQDVDRIDFMFRNTRNVVYGVFSENGIVVIPDIVLQTSGVMDALIMVGKDGVYTMDRMEIPVIERPMPPGYVMTTRGQIVTYDDFANVLSQFDLLQKSGGTMTGDIDMNQYMITNLDDAENPGDAVSKHYADRIYVSLAGGKMTGRLTGMQAPVSDDEAANKKYVDDTAASAENAAKNASKEYIDSIVTSKAWNEKDVSVSTNWKGSAAPYTQDVAVSGLTADHLVFVDVKIASNASASAAQDQIGAWGEIYRAVPGAGKITLYASGKTATALTMTVRFRGK